MPVYRVKLTGDKKKNLEGLVQKGGKEYRIKHAQILLKLDGRPENKAWTYDRIKKAYSASNGTIAGAAKRFVMEGREGGCFGTEEAGKSSSEGCRRGRGADLPNCMFRTAGRMLTLDYADDSG